jgi:hypothetical protein
METELTSPVTSQRKVADCDRRIEVGSTVNSAIAGGLLSSGRGGGTVSVLAGAGVACVIGGAGFRAHPEPMKTMRASGINTFLRGRSCRKENRRSE